MRSVWLVYLLAVPPRALGFAPITHGLAIVAVASGPVTQAARAVTAVLRGLQRAARPTAVVVLLDNAQPQHSTDGLPTERVKECVNE